MTLNRMMTRKHAAILLILVSVSAKILAQGNVVPKPIRIRIGNFGRINDNYYRGAQPDRRDYSDLAALGIRTVIDLQRDGREDEQASVERAGMKFYRIPLTTLEQPPDAAVAQFLMLVNDTANQPVFVHCQGGRHRTGVMTAVYRMTHDGWTADQAYSEMKQYRFEGFPRHPALKNFVYSYYGLVDHPRLPEERRTTAVGAAK